MEQVLVTIGEKSYRCKVAKNEEDRKKGLMGITILPPDEGMLFVWDEEGTHEMWMKNTEIPLDQIGINDDEEVTLVHTAQPNQEILIPFHNTKYILEVNANSGIMQGDEVDIDDEQDLDKYVMKILAPDGSAQMLLQGGERIFSRISTKQIITWAKKAYKNRKNSDIYFKYCKRLGKRVFREIKAQDTRKPEYVESPKHD